MDPVAPTATSPLLDADGRVTQVVAEAFRVWDTLGLELGAAAIVTSPTPWSKLLIEAASCYGAFPFLVSHGDDGGVHSLRQRLSRYPAVCAAEVTGSAAAVDLLLEALPPESRVMFAGLTSERLTIDYYVNVHRKGLQLYSTRLMPAQRVLEAESSNSRRPQRAARVLVEPARRALADAAIALVAETS